MMLVRTRLIITMTIAFCVFALARTSILNAEVVTSQRWGLFIGINDYIHLEDLRFAVSDQTELSNAMRSCGIDDKHSFMMVDGAKDQKMLPFRSNIMRQVQMVARLARDSDMVVVCFSGHGVQINDQAYLCPLDADLEDPNSLIQVQWVYQQLKDCRAQVRLVLLDACRNQVRLQGRRAPFAASNTSAIKFSQSHSTKIPEGVLVMNSCTDGEYSQEDASLNHGVFVHYILQGLKGQADLNKNQEIAIEELLHFVSAQTRIYVEAKFSQLQRPTLQGDFNSDALQTVLSFHRAYRIETLRTALYRYWEHQQSIRGIEGLDRFRRSHEEELAAAVKAEEPEALELMGWIYGEGLMGVEKAADAFSYIEAAAASGSSTGLASLGLCYELGIGCDSDARKAMDLYQQSMKKGFDKATLRYWCLKVANCLSIGIAPTPKTIAELTRFTEEGESYAAMWLSRLFDQGIGLPVDGTKAFELVSRAAQSDDHTAYSELAFFYEKGIGTIKNRTLARFYYRKALDQMKRWAMLVQQTAPLSWHEERWNLVHEGLKRVGE